MQQFRGSLDSMKHASQRMGTGVFFCVCPVIEDEEGVVEIPIVQII